MTDDDVEGRILMQDMFTEIGFPNIAHYEESGGIAISYFEKLSLPNCSCNCVGSEYAGVTAHRF